jgi:hypothetical protein
VYDVTFHFSTIRDAVEPTPANVNNILIGAMLGGSVVTGCNLCNHGMARFQVGDGGDGLQIRRLAANILNKQSRTTDRVGPPAGGGGWAWG